MEQKTDKNECKQKQSWLDSNALEKSNIKLYQK